MNEWQSIQRLRDEASGSYAAELLNSARFDAPHAGARHRLLHSLGLASGAIAITKGVQASASVAPPALGSTAGASVAVGGAGSAAALLGGGAVVGGSVAVPSAPLAASAMGGAALGGAGATFGSGSAALTTGGAAASANGGLQLAAGGLGVSGASMGMLSAFSGAKGAGAWLASGVIAKWVAIGLLVGGAGSLAVSELSVSESSGDSRVVALRPSTISNAPRLGQSSEPEFLNSDTETPSAASPDVAPAKTARPGQKARPKRAIGRRGSGHARSRKSSAEREPAEFGLTQEIALIDRARGALREGDAKLALTELETHQLQFGSATLKPEAEILRIEALIVQGERPLARRKARAFLSEYPASPHRERVLALLADAGG